MVHAVITGDPLAAYSPLVVNREGCKFESSCF